MGLIDWSDSDEMLGLLVEYVADEAVASHGDASRAHFLNQLSRELGAVAGQDFDSVDRIERTLREIHDSSRGSLPATRSWLTWTPASKSYIASERRIVCAESPMKIHMAWRVAYWLLSAIFVITAALTMLHIKAGFLTSYAADLFLPPWLYIVLRRLAGPRSPVSPLSRWFGSSPALAAGSLFIGSVLSEISQIYWPKGFFAGTFDPLDLVAYGSGLLVCYLIERLQIRRALDDVGRPTPTQAVL